MWGKFRNSVDIILILSVATPVFVLSFNKIEDPDIWWHLKCGELFIENGQILRQEIFSYTAKGSPWVDGYLLAQALFYLSWKFLGVGGIISLGSFLAALSFVAAISASGKKNNVILSVVALPAVFLSIPSFLPRPALFTPLFSLVFLYLLELHRTASSKKVFLLIPLTALWANIHPAFWLGFVFTFFYLLAAIPDMRRVRVISLLLCSEVIASLANPYFHKIYYSAYEMYKNPYLKNTIIEWKPLFSEPSKFKGITYCFVFTLSIWLIAVVKRKFRIETAHALCFIFAALITIYSRRNILLFSVVSLPLTTWTLSRESGAPPVAAVRQPKIAQGIIKGAVVVSSLFLIWSSSTNRLSLWMNSFSDKGIGINENMFPSEMTDFLLKEPVKGRIFHPYELGGYLLFKLYPRYEVYFDGRVFPYLPEIYQVGERARVDFDSFMKLHSRYDFAAVLVPIYPESYWNLLDNLLDSLQRWAPVKANDWGVLFLERGKGNDEIIAKYEINLLSHPPKLGPPAPARFLYWRKALYPFGQIMWAKFYEHIGLYKLSAEVLQPVAEVKPSAENLEIWLGSLLIQAGEADNGLPYILKGLERSPRDPGGLSALADYYIAKRNYEEAEKVLLLLVEEKPRAAKVWNTLGELAFNRMDYPEAARRFEKALELDPDNEQYRQKLIQALYKFDPLRAEEMLKEKNKH